MDIKSVKSSNNVSLNTQVQHKVEKNKEEQIKVESSNIESSKVAIKAQEDKVNFTYASLSQKVAVKKQETDTVANVSEQQRLARVNELRDQVKNGQFKVNSSHIADKMMADKAAVSLLTN